MKVNHGADAMFLRSRLNEHVEAVMAGVRANCPSAVFEVLFPYDVNYPTPAGIHSLGGKLNSFVNLPVEWQKKETAGFDRLKTEALDFGAWCRDLNLSSEAIRLAVTFSVGQEKRFDTSFRFFSPVMHGRRNSRWPTPSARLSTFGPGTTFAC